MREEQIPQPDERELAKLLQASLGPEDDWDEDAVELILDLHGINSKNPTGRLKRTIDNIVLKKRDSGEHIPESLLNLQQKLENLS
ncbi:MAG TPA: hypothetical protein DC054_09270 [Blastocatellia bacterium]|nr:hypothetical protein [Blastocatellia bacterium]